MLFQFIQNIPYIYSQVWFPGLASKLYPCADHGVSPSDFVPSFCNVSQSIPSLTIPRRLPGIRMFSLPGRRVFAQLSLLKGRRFELDKVLKEKCRNFSICFKEIGGSLKSMCSCAASFAETVDVYSIINNINYFRPFLLF